MFFARSHNERLLQLVTRDLNGWPTQRVNDQLSVQLNHHQSVQISGRKQRLFMAAIYNSQFRSQGSSALNCRLLITARQRGWIHRYPVYFRVRRGQRTQAAPLLNFLNSLAILRQTIAELDYRRFALHIEPGRWHCEIEPWGASEVVCHFPPIRRYLRLLPQQRMLLLSVFSMLNEAMERFDHLQAPVH